MDSVLFNKIKKFVISETGIQLTEQKFYLIKSRFEPLLEKYKISNYGELITKTAIDRVLKREVIDAITTNETYFFRDTKPFELIKMKLASDVLENSNRLNIWSAAASTGQEAYSIAIVLKQILFDFNKFNVQIDGTDISTDAITKANRGEYSPFEVKRGISPTDLGKYFNKVGSNYKIKDELRSIVAFSNANLLKFRPISKKYDIALCRNIAIYFDKADKRKLFKTIHSGLKDNGVLIIGSTESIIELSDLFAKETFHGVVFYRKK